MKNNNKEKKKEVSYLFVKTGETLRACDVARSLRRKYKRELLHRSGGRMCMAKMV